MDDVGELLRRDELHQAHQKRCAACRHAAEVERALGPLPVMKEGGFLGFVFSTMNVGRQLPEPLRSLASMAVFGGWLVLLMLVLALLRFIVEPAAGFEPSPTPVLQLLGVWFGWLMASLLWDKVYPAQTFRARLLKAVTTLALVAAMAWRGMDPLEQAGVLPFVLIALYIRREHRKEKEADPRHAKKTPSLAPGADPPTLPGTRVEPELEPGAIRPKVGVGRDDH